MLAGFELKWSPGMWAGVVWVRVPAETTQVNHSLQVPYRPLHSLHKKQEEGIPAKTVNFALKDRGIETLSFYPVF